MKTNMENASVMDPGSLNASQNPLYLLSASLQYLLAYTKALAKECKPPEEEEGPITVISFSPTPKESMQAPSNMAFLIMCSSREFETTIRQS